MRLFLILLLPLEFSFPAAGWAAEAVLLKPLSNSVPRYGGLEFEIGVDTVYEHPFDPRQVELNLVVTPPSGGELRVPAFYMQPYEYQERSRSGRPAAWMYPAGPPGWRARFAPAEEGNYSATAEVIDRAGRRRSAPVQFTSTPSASRGFVRVSQKDPRYFEFSDGQPFYPIGQNLAFIGEGQYVTPPKVDAIFGQLSKNGANYLRIWTCCHDWALAIEARKSAWGRSWSWNPPFVPDPGQAGSGRKCLRLESGPALAVSPSHSVALRPRTRYALSGRVQAKTAGQIKISVGRHETTQAIQPGDWQPFTFHFETGSDEYWLGRTALGLQGAAAARLDGLSLQEAQGGPELLWEAAINRPERGYYNPIDCFLLDRIVDAAQRHGIYLQLCLITRDAYMQDLKNAGSPEYQQAIGDAKNLLRYAVARWGASTQVATWEYFNEIDPGLPMERFYRVLGEYLQELDIYGHLRSTSTWGPSARDARHPQLDVADVHFYLRPVEPRPYEDEVQAAVGNAGWLREQAPAKPALIGEFGLADPQWRPTREMRDSPEVLDFHNGLWASALAGNSGTALFWWWDRLDPRNHYPHYRPLADFLAGIPWTTAQLQPMQADVSDPQIRLVGLQGTGQAYLWLFDRRASWENVVVRGQTPGAVEGLTVELKNLPAGNYCVQWWETRSGEIVHQHQTAAAEAGLKVVVPQFQRDIAGKVLYVSQ